MIGGGRQLRRSRDGEETGRMEHRAVRVRTRVIGAEPTLTANSLERLCFRKTRSKENESGLELREFCPVAFSDHYSII